MDGRGKEGQAQEAVDEEPHCAIRRCTEFQTEGKGSAGGGCGEEGHMV